MLTFEKLIMNSKIKKGDKFKYFPTPKKVKISKSLTGYEEEQEFPTEDFKSWIYLGTEGSKVIFVSDSPTKNELVVKGKIGAKNAHKAIRKIVNSYGKGFTVKAFPVDEEFWKLHEDELSDSSFWLYDRKMLYDKVSGKYNIFGVKATRDDVFLKYYPKLEVLCDESNIFQIENVEKEVCHGIRIVLELPLNTAVDNDVIMA